MLARIPGQGEQAGSPIIPGTIRAFYLVANEVNFRDDAPDR